MLNTSVIVLTYKNKVLLMVKDFNQFDDAQNVWGMMESNKRTSESYPEAIIRKTKEEMNIVLGDVSFLSKKDHDGAEVYFLHGKLTDDNVNSIVRKEGHEIRFFALPEVQNLSVTPFTLDLLAEFQNKIEELLVYKAF